MRGNGAVEDSWTFVCAEEGECEGWRVEWREVVDGSSLVVIGREFMALSICTCCILASIRELGCSERAGVGEDVAGAVGMPPPRDCARA